VSGGQSITHLIYQDFQAPFSKFKVVIKSEFEKALLWDWFILESIRVAIIIFIFTHVREAYEVYVFLEGHAEYCVGSICLTDFLSQSISPKL